MAAFSRGRTLFNLSTHTLRPLPSCPQCIRPIQQYRVFSCSNQYASASPRKPTTPQKTPDVKTQAKAPSFRPASHNPFAPGTTVQNPRLATMPPSQINPQTLNVLLTKPEQIYQSPSFTTYTWSCYSLSLFFMGYGGYALSFWGITVPGLNPWVPVGYGVTSFVLFLTGSWTLSASTKLVRGIEAVPKHFQGEPLHLRLTLSRFVPWRTKTVELPLSDVYLDKSVRDVLFGATPRKIRQPLSETNFALRPWVWMGRGIVDFGTQTRSMFTREHMVKILIKGEAFKLDVRGMALGGAEGEFLHFCHRFKIC
jgi:hypothetical protein